MPSQPPLDDFVLLLSSCAAFAPLNLSLPMRSKNWSLLCLMLSPSSTLRVKTVTQWDLELVSFILVPRTRRISTAAARLTRSAAVLMGTILAPCKWCALST